MTDGAGAVYYTTALEMSRHPYVVDILRRISGPIYMFMYLNAAAIDWSPTMEPTMETHDELVRSVSGGYAETAEAHIGRHMGLSLRIAGWEMPA